MLPVILALFEIEQVIQLGLAGVAIVVLSSLLYKAWKYNIKKDEVCAEEINKRDEIILDLQKQTLAALIENNNILKKFTED